MSINELQGSIVLSMASRRIIVDSYGERSRRNGDLGCSEVAYFDPDIQAIEDFEMRLERELESETQTNEVI